MYAKLQLLDDAIAVIISDHVPSSDWSILFAVYKVLSSG